MKFTFDSEDPQETERAKRCIQDMLRRGYSIFVDVDGKLCPCRQFDHETCSYVIADGPLYAGDQPSPIVPIQQTPEPVAKKGRGRSRSVPAKGTKATAVAPTAGG